VPKQIYEVRIHGLLGEDWADWFEGFSMRTEDGETTILEGEVKDSAALFGVLAKIRDLNVTLISIKLLA